MLKCIINRKCCCLSLSWLQNWNLAISWSTVWLCPECWPCLVLVFPSDWLRISRMLCTAADAASAPRFLPCCRIKTSLISALHHVLAYNRYNCLKEQSIKLHDITSVHCKLVNDNNNPQRTVAHCTWIKLLSMLLINVTLVTRTYFKLPWGTSWGGRWCRSVSLLRAHLYRLRRPKVKYYLHT